MLLYKSPTKTSGVNHELGFSGSFPFNYAICSASSFRTMLRRWACPVRPIPFLVSRVQEPAYRTQSATQASIPEPAWRLSMRARVDQPSSRRALVSQRRYQKEPTSLILAAVSKMIIMLTIDNEMRQLRELTVLHNLWSRERRTNLRVVLYGVFIILVPKCNITKLFRVQHVLHLLSPLLEWKL